MNNNQDYIVRCDRAGVFFGKIKERNGSEVTICPRPRCRPQAWHDDTDEVFGADKRRLRRRCDSKSD